MSATFVITKPNAYYRFNLKAGNGLVILTSEGYVTKQGCKDGIQSVKDNAPLDSRYERKVSANRQYYFNLKASNGQVIGTSETYITESGRENGILSVKSNAPDAGIDDQA